MTHFEDLDILERSLKNPIKVPVHEVTGMKTAEDNYGAFISMTPGQPYQFNTSIYICTATLTSPPYQIICQMLTYAE